MNIQSLRDNLGALVQSKSDIQKQILAEMDIHYDVSFKVQILEKKVNKLGGGDQDEGRERKMEYEKLQQQVENLNKQLSTLNSQTLKLEETMKTLILSYDTEMKKIAETVGIK